MKIKLNLNDNFDKKVEELSKKYGKNFEIMNGFSNSRLNFTDYIENFLKSKSVVDVALDSSSNSTTKDIKTMLSDMVKPHMKLLSFNKIFDRIEKNMD